MKAKRAKGNLKPGKRLQRSDSYLYNFDFPNNIGIALNLLKKNPNLKLMSI
jgi:hypothetical protein